MIRICHRHFVPVTHAGECRFCRRSRNEDTVQLLLSDGLILSASDEDNYVDFTDSHVEPLVGDLRKDLVFKRLRKALKVQLDWLHAFSVIQAEVMNETLAAQLAAIGRCESDYHCRHREGRPHHCIEVLLLGGLVDNDKRS